MKINFDELQQEIMIRIWQSNELSGKQADNYSHLAIDEIKKHIERMETRSYFFVPQPTRNTVPVNPATLLMKGEDL